MKKAAEESAAFSLCNFARLRVSSCYASWPPASGEGQSERWTRSFFPKAFAYFPRVERRISSAWFSIREMADFFVRSFRAIASCVIPAFSRARRSMTLNSNASYPPSKFSANFGLRFFRRSMYLSTSLMIVFSFENAQPDDFQPTRFPAVGFSVVSSKNHLSGSTDSMRRSTPRTGNCFRQSALGSPRDLLCRLIS